jgi:hypothetical protein
MRHFDGVAPIVLHIGRLASLTHSQERRSDPILSFW